MLQTIPIEIRNAGGDRNSEKEGRDIEWPEWGGEGDRPSVKRKGREREGDIHVTKVDIEII